MEKRKKNLFQKASLLFGAVSLILAVVSAVLLYLRVDSVGGDNPVAASLLASIIFFLSVGGVLLFIGLSNLPSFGFARHESSGSASEKNDVTHE